MALSHAPLEQTSPLAQSTSVRHAWHAPEGPQTPRSHCESALHPTHVEDSSQTGVVPAQSPESTQPTQAPLSSSQSWPGHCESLVHPVQTLPSQRGVVPEQWALVLHSTHSPELPHTAPGHSVSAVQGTHWLAGLQTRPPQESELVQGTQAPPTQKGSSPAAAQSASWLHAPQVPLFVSQMGLVPVQAEVSRVPHSTQRSDSQSWPRPAPWQA